MRSLMLSSTAAILFTAGLAWAQTAAPASTGAPNGPVETAPGLSPGKTTPPNATMGTSSSMAAPDSSSQAATNTMATPPVAMKKKRHHHEQMGTLAADTGAAGYLRSAQTEISKHDKARADDALSQAETRLLTRSVPQSNTNPVDDSPAITSIENARKALASGDMTQASTDTDMAMSQLHHGHMDHMMNNNGAPTTNPMTNKTTVPGADYPAGTSVLSNPTSDPQTKN